MRFKILFAVLAALGVGSALRAATSVTHDEFTWTFSSDHTVGQFADGSWYVIDTGGGVEITAIAPADPNAGDANDLNGSAVNVMPGDKQMWMSYWNRGDYIPARNIALQLPYTVSAGDTVLSAISRVDSATPDPPMEKIRALTVLSEAPPANSFRPGYAGSAKPILYQVSDIDQSIFLSLADVGATKTIATLTDTFTGIFLDIQYEHLNSSLKTRERANYGRDIHREVVDAAILLNSDYTWAEKEPLAIQYLQQGLDLWRLRDLGFKWGANGGHNGGRKLHMAITAYAFGNAAWIAQLDKVNQYWQEDEQYAYVTESMLYKRTYPPYNPYTEDHLGMADWGVEQTTAPSKSSPDFGIVYRDVNARDTITATLIARLMGFEPQYNNPAMFDYYFDRWWPYYRDTPYSGGNPMSAWHIAFWEAYSDTAPSPPPSGGDNNPKRTRLRGAASGLLMTR